MELAPMVKLEQKKKPFPFINERSIEYAFTIKHLQKLCKGKLLDVGTGKSFWSYLVENGGYLILSSPCNEENYHEDIHTHPYARFGKGGNYITQVYSRNEINAWIQTTTFKIVDQEFFKVFTGEFWSFGEGIVLVEKVENRDMHHLTWILLQKERVLI